MLTMKLVVILACLVAIVTPAPQMLIGQSVMEAFKAAVTADADEAGGLTPAGDSAGPTTADNSVATAEEVNPSVASIVSEIASVGTPVVNVPAAIPSSDIPSAVFVSRPVAPPVLIRPTPTVASPLPVATVVFAASVTGKPAAANPVVAIIVPRRPSPSAELQRSALISALQVGQSISNDVASVVDADVPVARSFDASATSGTGAASLIGVPVVVPILMDERDPIVGNAYGFRFRSGDGQFRSEKSSLKPLPVGASPNAIPEYETVGEYSFTHPDGTVNRITYTAGVNGYVAQGNMLPTPPPMPIWAIEQIRFAEEQKRLQAAAASAAPAPNALVPAAPAPAAPVPAATVPAAV